MNDESVERERAALFQLIVRSIEEFAIFLVEGDGTVTSWNPGVRKVLGYEEEEFVGMDVALIFTPEDREQRASRIELETAERTGAAVDRRWHLRKDGSQFWGDGMTIALRARTTVVGFVKIMRDDTERKLLEDKLVEASRLKDLFLAKMAHELRTPLMSIIGWTQILRDGNPDAATLTAAVNAIESGALTQSRLIEDLYDIARLSGGKLELNRVAVDLRQLVRTIVDSMRPQALQREVRLEADLVDVPTIIYGDPDRLRQIIGNVLSNALKFTPSEGEVRVALTRTSRKGVVTISDTGAGIEPENLSKIFDPWVQGDGADAPTEQGLGLGLSIACEFIQLHNGSIKAHSDGKGKGSTFEIILPLIGG